jgi:hypothetical protein
LIEITPSETSASRSPSPTALKVISGGSAACFASGLKGDGITGGEGLVAMPFN